MHQSGLKIPIIKALGHSEDGFYARYDEGQKGSPIARETAILRGWGRPNQ